MKDVAVNVACVMITFVLESPVTQFYILDGQENYCDVKNY